MVDAPLSRTDRIASRSTRDIERVRLKRLEAHAMDERLNTAGHQLAGYAKLHDSRRVDESGAPALREIIIRWLDGEPSQRSKLVAALQRLNREHPRLYRVVNAIISPVEQGENAPTERVLAAQLAMSKTTVHRCIAAIRQWLIDEQIV